MPLTIRANVRLLPGCRLYYDCPLQGGDYKSQLFFDKHRGKYATFVDYVADVVGILDHKGRLPGRYLDSSGVIAQFEGEEKPASIQARHCIVADHSKMIPVEDTGVPERLGDLEHPVLFYPDDLVLFKKKPSEDLSDEPRKVAGVFLGEPFTKDNIPRYQVLATAAEKQKRDQKLHEENEKRPEGDRLCLHLLPDQMDWNVPGDDIELVARGNVWALYNDSEKLLFESDEAESNFWINSTGRYVSNDIQERVLGIPKRMLEITHGLSLEDAYRLFLSDEADVIGPAFSNPGDGPRYKAKRLHECFAHFRERARAATKRLWSHQVKASAA